MNLDIAYAEYGPGGRSTLASLVLRHAGIMVTQAMTEWKWHASDRSAAYDVVAVACKGEGEQLIQLISAVACGALQVYVFGPKTATQSSRSVP